MHLNKKCEFHGRKINKKDVHMGNWIVFPSSLTYESI